MPRVTDDEVKAIIATDLDTNAFIETATLIVDDQLSSRGFSVSRLKQIELYLAAHFTTLRERQLVSEKFGNAAETYQGKTGMNLQSSNYGQTAIVLDISGSLYRMGQGTASMETL